MNEKRTLTPAQLEKITIIRKKYGFSLTKIKEALVAVDWDMDKAEDLIFATLIPEWIEKLKDREIHVYGLNAQKVGDTISYIQIGCETDFVLMNENVLSLMHESLNAHNIEEHFHKQAPKIMALVQEKIVLKAHGSFHGPMMHYTSDINHGIASRLAVVQVNNDSNPEFINRLCKQLLIFPTESITEFKQQTWFINSSETVQQHLDEHQVEVLKLISV